MAIQPDDERINKLLDKSAVVKWSMESLGMDSQSFVAQLATQKLDSELDKEAVKLVTKKFGKRFGKEAEKYLQTNDPEVRFFIFMNAFKYISPEIADEIGPTLHKMVKEQIKTDKLSKYPQSSIQARKILYNHFKDKPLEKTPDNFTMTQNDSIESDLATQPLDQISFTFAKKPDYLKVKSGDLLMRPIELGVDVIANDVLDYSQSNSNVSFSEYMKRKYGPPEQLRKTPYVAGFSPMPPVFGNTQGQRSNPEKFYEPKSEIDFNSDTLFFNK